jgi:hypothetical protein
MLYPIHPESDRVGLSVRVCADGNREWLTADGKTALVFFEKGSWWARHSNKDPRQMFLSESAALDHLLNQQLKALRADRQH